MITPKDRLAQKSFFTLLVTGLLVFHAVAPVPAQGIPPLLEPPPGSTITTDPVTFSGAHTSADLKHLLRIGSSLGGSDLFSQSLGTGHSATVSGLPSSGAIYVSYWTLNSAGWFVNRVVFTMNVGSGAPRVWNCPAGDVDCLINAITIGNGSGNLEIIQLAAGTYILDDFYNNGHLMPTIRGNITIQGAGTAATIIRSSLSSLSLSRNVFTFLVAEDSTFELAALSILKGGTVILNNGGTAKVREVMIADNQILENFFYGNAIFNNIGGIMRIQDSTVTNYQQATNGHSGGIINSGTMDITGSSITENNSQASSQGAGGIVNNPTGTLTIKTSTIARNRGHDPNPGAILNRGNLDLINSLVQDNVGFVGGLNAQGATNISGSIFTGNRSEGNFNGGAIFNSGPMTISKAVIAFNKAAGGGGIFYTGGFGGTLTIEDSVIFGNESESSIGGGIDIVNNGLITLTDTVVTNNTPNDCQGCP